MQHCNALVRSCIQCTIRMRQLTSESFSTSSSVSSPFIVSHLRPCKSPLGWSTQLSTSILKVCCNAKLFSKRLDWNLPKSEWTHRISENKSHEHHLVYVPLLYPSHQAVLPAHSVLLIPLHNVASRWAWLWCSRPLVYVHGRAPQTFFESFMQYQQSSTSTSPISPFPNPGWNFFSILVCVRHFGTISQVDFRVVFG